MGNVNSNDLLRGIRYPLKDTGLPSTDPADQQQYKYNALGERTGFTDQNGTVHEYVYDVLGRETDDKVTTLGSNVDPWARRRTTIYLPNGRVGRSILYGSVSGTDWVTEVQWSYNGLGDQATVQLGYRGGSGDLTGVEYVYDFNDTGTANRSRLTQMNYASGRPVHYGYGATGSLDDRISRVTFLADDDRTGPPSAVIFAVNMLVNTEAGDTFTFNELAAWLRDAGFTAVRQLDAPGPSPLILATKPE